MSSHQECWQHCRRDVITAITHHQIRHEVVRLTEHELKKKSFVTSLAGMNFTTVLIPSVFIVMLPSLPFLTSPPLDVLLAVVELTWGRVSVLWELYNHSLVDGPLNRGHWGSSTHHLRVKGRARKAAFYILFMFFFSFKILQIFVLDYRPTLFIHERWMV